MYCEIVLQGRLKIEDIVLQYSHCIAEKEAWRVGFELQYTGVYCNRGTWVRLGICIAIQKIVLRLWSKGKAGLYCNTVASQAMIQQGLGSRRAPRGVLGAQAGAGALGWACVGRWAGRGRRGALQAGHADGVAHGRQGARQAGHAVGARAVGRHRRAGRRAGAGRAAGRR